MRGLSGRLCWLLRLVQHETGRNDPIGTPRHCDLQNVTARLWHLGSGRGARHEVVCTRIGVDPTAPLGLGQALELADAVVQVAAVVAPQVEAERVNRLVA